MRIHRWRGRGDGECLRVAHIAWHTEGAAGAGLREAHGEPTPSAPPGGATTEGTAGRVESRDLDLETDQKTQSK